MSKILKMPNNANDLENKTPEELLNIFGAMTFAIAYMLQEKTDDCGGCVGMNLLDVFIDANKQASVMFANNKSKEKK